MWVCMCNLDPFNFSQLNAVITAFPTAVASVCIAVFLRTVTSLTLALPEWLLLIIIM